MLKNTLLSQGHSTPAVAALVAFTEELRSASENQAASKRQKLSGFTCAIARQPAAYRSEALRCAAARLLNLSVDANFWLDFILAWHEIQATMAAWLATMGS